MKCLIATISGPEVGHLCEKYNYRLTHSGSELLGFTSTSSLTMNEKFSTPHEAAECGIEHFEFIVSEWVQVNPGNSRAMSALTFLLLFKLNTLETKIVKLWVSRSHGYYTTIMTSRRLFRHNAASRGEKTTNQKIGIRIVHESWIIICNDQLISSSSLLLPSKGARARAWESGITPWLTLMNLAISKI